jgi:hypothetical protein
MLKLREYEEVKIISLKEYLERLLQKSQFSHSRSDSERESGSNCLKNHIPDRSIRG